MSTLFDLPPTKSAVLSTDGTYRYHLYRAVPGAGQRIATFIMLNPSTADHEVDDPTIRKCLGFSQRWSVGELNVVNLFALRATNPAEIGRTVDPIAIGQENQAWIERAVRLASAGLVVCAWGTFGSFMSQDKRVLNWIEDKCEPMALGITKGGHPRHPLYAPYSAKLVSFGRRRLTEELWQLADHAKR